MPILPRSLTPAFRGWAIAWAVTIAVVVTAAILPAPSARAARPPSPATVVRTVTSRPAAQPSPEAFSAAVSALEPFVRRRADGTFGIDAPAAVIARVPASVYAAVRKSSELVNQDITAGRLTSRADGTVSLAATAATTTASTLAAATSGNSISVAWWGVTIHLDNATATQLINALTAAATIDSVLAILVTAGVISSAAAVPLAVIAAILAIVTSSLSACLTAGGLDLYITWLVFGWCSAPAA